MPLAFQTAKKKSAEIEISVIVPFYNSEDHIEHCLRALLEQTYPSNGYEIIMVDNNSSDRSAEIVRRYAQVRLIAENKQSAYAARNSGVVAARGNIIAFTDADCVPSRDWLEKMVYSLVSSDAGVIQGGRTYAFDGITLSLLADFESQRAAYVFSAKEIGLYYGYTNNMVIRRDLFDCSGPFLEIARGADTLFVLQAIQQHSTDIVRYAPQAQVRHLEMTNPWKYLRKKFIYGESFQLNYERRKETHRPLTWKERKLIIDRTLAGAKYSRLQVFMLFCFVFAGAICFQSGRLSVKLCGNK